MTEYIKLEQLKEVLNSLSKHFDYAKKTRYSISIPCLGTSEGILTFKLNNKNQFECTSTLIIKK